MLYIVQNPEKIGKWVRKWYYFVISTDYVTEVVITATFGFANVYYN